MTETCKDLAVAVLVLLLPLVALAWELHTGITTRADLFTAYMMVVAALFGLMAVYNSHLAYSMSRVRKGMYDD